MKKTIYLSFISMVLFTLITGGIYPLVIMGISKIFFSYQSEGSLIKDGDKVIGSELIGQKFDTAIYFNSRPSAIDDNPNPSGASNRGPTSDTLKKTIEQRRNDYSSLNYLKEGTYIPDDAIFTSGSGVDPDISFQNALYQVDRIAKVRNFDVNKTKKLHELILNSVSRPQFGILGETRVNVLKLNILLDHL